MSTPHKHAEVIKAWADGKQIQTNSMHGTGWYDIASPHWNEAQEYRVKPETIRYRVALVGPYPLLCTDEEAAGRVSISKHFTRWLTDWVDVEV